MNQGVRPGARTGRTLRQQDFRPPKVIGHASQKPITTGRTRTEQTPGSMQSRKPARGYTLRSIFGSC